MHYLTVICGHQLSNKSSTRNVDNENSDDESVSEFWFYILQAQEY